jgi:hypothetical protein
VVELLHSSSPGKLPDFALEFLHGHFSVDLSTFLVGFPLTSIAVIDPAVEVPRRLKFVLTRIEEHRSFAFPGTPGIHAIRPLTGMGLSVEPFVCAGVFRSSAKLAVRNIIVVIVVTLCENDFRTIVNAPCFFAFPVTKEDCRLAKIGDFFMKQPSKLFAWVKRIITH